MEQLTEQEKNMLEQLRANPEWDNIAIAHYLCISCLSVGNFMNPIYKKLGIEGGRGIHKRSRLDEMLADGEV